MEKAIKHFGLFFLIPLILISSSLSVTVSASTHDDVSILIGRLNAEYANAPKNISQISEYIATQQSDGSWKDIEYTDRSRTNWKPAEHYHRIARCSIFYVNGGDSSVDNQKLLNCILKGLQYWYNHDYASNNWFDNQIGKQHTLGPLALLLGSSLPDSLKQRIINDLPVSTLNWTGQNKIWFAEEMIWRGCLQHDAKLIQAASDSITNVIKISTSEGIMPDFSFRQHGPQVYNGGYGRSFIQIIIDWSNRLKGLPFEIPKDKLSLFTTFLLNGCQWMNFHNTWDYQVTGRELSRKDGVGAASLNKSLNLYSNIDSENSEKLKAFADHVAGKNNSACVGNRYFRYVDYMVHRRGNYFFSIRMNSTRTSRTEAGNNENTQGDYLSDGATTVMTTGSEFDNIFPCWKWSNIPGTTTPQHKAGPKPKDWGKAGSTSFVGGLSTGDYGVATYDMDWDSTQVKKSWFLFDNEIVCLAAGISSCSKEEIATTLNQTIQSGRIQVYDAKNASYYLTANSAVETVASRVWHSNVGYCFTEPQQVTVSGKSVTAPWSSIGTSRGAETKNIFLLTKSHGIAPKDGSFSYIVVPGIDQDKFMNYNTKHISIEANTKSFQVVCNELLNLYGAVAYRAGTINLDKALQLQCDNKGLFMVQCTNGIYKIWCADPTQTLSSIHLTLKAGKKVIYDGNIQLPSGNEKGCTQRVICNK